MTSIVRGPRPDITPAQIVGILVAAVPVVASLLHAFGVFDASAAQQDAIRDAIVWCGVTAGVLVASDAGVRAARNAADAKRDVAALGAPDMPHAHVPEDIEDGPDDASPVTDSELAAILAPDSGAVPDQPKDRP
jgi:hypothetical protein